MQSYKKIYNILYRLEMLKEEALKEIFDRTGMFVTHEEKTTYRSIVGHTPGYVRYHIKKKHFKDSKKIMMLSKQVDRAYKEITKKYESQTHRTITETIENCTKIGWQEKW